MHQWLNSQTGSDVPELYTFFFFCQTWIGMFVDFQSSNLRADLVLLPAEGGFKAEASRQIPSSPSHCLPRGFKPLGRAQRWERCQTHPPQAILLHTHHLPMVTASLADGELKRFFKQCYQVHTTPLGRISGTLSIPSWKSPPLLDEVPRHPGCLSQPCLSLSPWCNRILVTASPFTLRRVPV